MKICLIISGLPGSGKSTLAEQLSKLSAFSAKVICTDDYFVDVNGNYNFDPTKLHYNHTQALVEFKRAIKDSINFVMVTNTCTQTWEYKRYEDFAKENGYMVFPVVLRKNKDQVFNNLHGVPLEIVEKMQNRLVSDFVKPKLKK